MPMGFEGARGGRAGGKERVPGIFFVGGVELHYYTLCCVVLRLSLYLFDSFFYSFVLLLGLFGFVRICLIVLFPPLLVFCCCRFVAPSQRMDEPFRPLTNSLMII